MQPGSAVHIDYADEVLTGILIQEKPHIILKLASGYNIVLDQKKIKKISVVADPKLVVAPKSEQKHAEKQNGKHIAILHTGGTVASKIDYTTGAVIAGFSPEDIIRMYPEITEIATISSRLIRNMQSEMMRFPHYNLIAEAICDEVKKGADAIVITHGTDELHYTSAALAFMFDNLTIPVVMVASQRSSDRPSSDARQNLLGGVLYASQGRPGVVICMHASESDDTSVILSGLAARKFHTTRRDAFLATTGQPIAHVHLDTRTIAYTSDKIAEKQERQSQQSAKTHSTLTYKKFNEHLKIGLLKGRPMMYAEEILFYKDWDGLIIEGLGLGHMPTQKIDEYTGENEKIYAALQKVAAKIPTVLTSQCIYGRVNMHVYTPGRELFDLGLLGHGLDMTPETAYMKLAYLLSSAKKEEVGTLFQTNLRGEITERTEHA